MHTCNFSRHGYVSLWGFLFAMPYDVVKKSSLTIHLVWYGGVVKTGPGAFVGRQFRLLKDLTLIDDYRAMSI